MNTHSALRQFLLLCGILGLPLLAGSAEIPFDPMRGLVEIEIVINDTIHGKFGLDTGADLFYVDSTFAAHHGLHSTVVAELSTVSGINGSCSAYPVSLRSLRIGDLPMQTNVPAKIIDLRELSRAGVSSHPDGLVGRKILEQYYITVDYPRQRLEIRTDEPHALAGRPYHTIPFELEHHFIVVDAIIENSLPAGRYTCHMILDYCSSDNLVAEVFLNRVGLKANVDSHTICFDSLTVGGAITSGEVCSQIISSKIYKSFSPCGECDGILGGTFLNSHTITIDYRHQQIYVPY